jgi:hypothetical protein
MLFSTYNNKLLFNWKNNVKLIFIFPIMLFWDDNVLCESGEESDINQKTESIDDEKKSYKKIIYFSIGLIILTVICYYGYNNHFNPGSGSVPGSSNIDDMTGNHINSCYKSITNQYCLGSDIEPIKQVICQMSNTVKNQIHWSTYSPYEISSLPDSTKVYFLDHIPPIDVHPKDYTFSVITIRDLFRAIHNNHLTFSKYPYRQELMRLLLYKDKNNF